MSSERASDYLHEIHIDVRDDPPDYNDVMRMSHIPTRPLLEGGARDTPGQTISTSSRNTTNIMSSEHASPVPCDPPNYNYVMNMSQIPITPLLERSEDGTTFGVTTFPTEPPLEGRQNGTPFISIFGAGTCIKFEAATLGMGISPPRLFYIRDSDGSLQAKGKTNSHHSVIQNFDEMEVLRIILGSVDDENGSTIREFSVVHNHVDLGTIKVAENSLPSTSLQIIRENGTPIPVKSMRIGDYVVFRNQSSIIPLCNIEMPDIFNTDNFNIKIIFHPHTGITEDEQLLCTAAAIAFKSTMKQKAERQRRCWLCYLSIVYTIFFIVVIVVSVLAMKRLENIYARRERMLSEQLTRFTKQ